MSIPVKSVADRSNLRIWAEISVFAMILALSFSAVSWYLLSFSEKTHWLANLSALFSVGYGTYFLARALRKWIVKKLYRAALFAVWILVVQIFTLKFLLHSAETLSIFQLITNPFISFTFQDLFHAEIWHMFLFLMMIWIGSTFAAQPVDAYRALAIFQFNIFIFIVYIFSVLDVNSQLPLFNFFSFLFFSLISLATGRIAQLAYEKGGKLPALQKVWGLGIPAAALTIVAFSIFAGWLSNGSLAPAASALVMIALGLLIAVIAVIAIPMVIVLSLIVPGLLNLIKTYLANFINQNKNILNILNPVAPEKNAGVSSIINTGTLIGLLIFAGGLIFLIFLNLQRKEKKQRLEQEDEKFNSTYHGKIPPAGDSKKARNLFGLKGWLVSERVRKIYIQLLELCYRLDMKREDADTPQEFMAQMYSLFPDYVDELKTITDAYEKVRYGKLPEEFVEIHNVTKAWEKISQAGNKLISVRKKLVKEINYH